MNPAQLIVALLLGCVAAQDTNSVISNVNRIFEQSALNTILPCIQNANCSSCVGSSSCVWMTGASLYVSRDSSQLYDSKGAEFCWKGNGLGAASDVYLINAKDANPANIYVVAGFNNFKWNQCSLTGGAALAIGLIVPIAVIILLALLICICCICCRRLKHKNSKEDRQNMVKKDKRANWLARRVK
ncbi:hypothetical protein AKO1_006593 [Acrasis kona]|uniref:Uncharacterized protein n=1 Tax=Acrasis kona TaxID=1008807 RepID=A0AAW2YW09_9EUKA